MRAAGSMAGRKKAFARQTSLAALIVDLWFLSPSLPRSHAAPRRASSAGGKIGAPTTASPRRTQRYRHRRPLRDSRTRSRRGCFLSRTAQKKLQRDKKPVHPAAAESQTFAGNGGDRLEKHTTAKDARMKARNGYARTVPQVRVVRSQRALSRRTGWELVRGVSH